MLNLGNLHEVIADRGTFKNCSLCLFSFGLAVGIWQEAVDEAVLSSSGVFFCSNSVLYVGMYTVYSMYITSRMYHLI